MIQSCQAWRCSGPSPCTVQKTRVVAWLLGAPGIAARKREELCEDEDDEDDEEDDELLDVEKLRPKGSVRARVKPRAKVDPDEVGGTRCPAPCRRKAEEEEDQMPDEGREGEKPRQEAGWARRGARAGWGWASVGRTEARAGRRTKLMVGVGTARMFWVRDA